MGFSDQLIPSDVKNQRLQPFMPPPGSRANQGPPWGPKEPEKQLSVTQKETQSGLQGTPQEEGKSECTENEENITIADPLEFFNLLCDLEQNLCLVFNKLNNIEYESGIVNLSNYPLTNIERNVLSKGLGFCPTPGTPDIGNLIQDLDEFKRKTRLQLFFSGNNENPSEDSNQSDAPFEHKSFKK